MQVSPTKQRRAPRVKAIACPMCRTLVQLDSIVRVHVDDVDREGGATSSRPVDAASAVDVEGSGEEDEELVAKFGTKVQRVVRELNGRWASGFAGF